MSKQSTSARTNTNIVQSGDQNAVQTGSGTQKVTKTVISRAPAKRAKYFTVGACLTAVAVGFASWGFALGTLTADQRQILLWILPIASGFACGAFAGGITAKAQGWVPGLIVTATGGFAVWLITFFLLFPSPKNASTVSPSGPGVTAPGAGGTP